MCSVSAADKKREREVHLQVLLSGNSQGSVLGNITLRNIIELYLAVFCHHAYEGKGKTHPRTGNESPEGE
jgi:hypothetical protein